MEEKSTNSSMDAVLKKLEELTSAAKENYIRTMYRDLPLKWENRDGILYLDGVWIAPAAVVDMERMDEYIADATLDTIMIPVIDGTLDIVIFGGEYDFGIQHVDRYIKREWRCPEE